MNRKGRTSQAAPPPSAEGPPPSAEGPPPSAEGPPPSAEGAASIHQSDIFVRSICIAEAHEKDGEVPWVSLTLTQGVEMNRCKVMPERVVFQMRVEGLTVDNIATVYNVLSGLLHSVV